MTGVSDVRPRIPSGYTLPNPQEDKTGYTSDNVHCLKIHLCDGVRAEALPSLGYAIDTCNDPNGEGLNNHKSMILPIGGVSRKLGTLICLDDNP